MAAGRELAGAVEGTGCTSGGLLRKLPRTTAFFPYFCRMESRVLSRAASFSFEGEAALFFDAVFSGEKAPLSGRSNREIWAGPDSAASLDERIPKSRMGEPFHRSSKSWQAVL